jgi:hypothetical protein
MWQLQYCLVSWHLFVAPVGIHTLPTLCLQEISTATGGKQHRRTLRQQQRPHHDPGLSTMSRANNEWITHTFWEPLAVAAMKHVHSIRCFCKLHTHTTALVASLTSFSATGLRLPARLAAVLYLTYNL